MLVVMLRWRCLLPQGFDQSLIPRISFRNRLLAEKTGLKSRNKSIKQRALLVSPSLYVNAVSTSLTPLIALSTVARITSSVDLAKGYGFLSTNGFHGAPEFDRTCGG